MSAGDGSARAPWAGTFRDKFVKHLADEVAYALRTFVPADAAESEREEETARALVLTFVSLMHHRRVSAATVVSRLRASADFIERELNKPAT